MFGESRWYYKTTDEYLLIEPPCVSLILTPFPHLKVGGCVVQCPGIALASPIAPGHPLTMDTAQASRYPTRRALRYCRRLAL